MSATESEGLIKQRQAVSTAYYASGRLVYGPRMDRLSTIAGSTDEPIVPSSLYECGI
jgi:hypothetical protein